MFRHKSKFNRYILLLYYYYSLIMYLAVRSFIVGGEVENLDWSLHIAKRYLNNLKKTWKS